MRGNDKILSTTTNKFNSMFQHRMKGSKVQIMDKILNDKPEVRNILTQDDVSNITNILHKTEKPKTFYNHNSKSQKDFNTNKHEQALPNKQSNRLYNNKTNLLKPDQTANIDLENTGKIPEEKDLLVIQNQNKVFSKVQNNGDRFNGTFNADNLKNEGVYYFVEGGHFNGKFQNDDPYQGYRVYADGSEQTGQFLAGKRHGNGKQIWKQRTQEFNGQFLHGRMNNGVLQTKEGRFEIKNGNFWDKPQRQHELKRDYV